MIHEKNMLAFVNDYPLIHLTYRRSSIANTRLKFFVKNGVGLGIFTKRYCIAQ